VTGDAGGGDGAAPRLASPERVRLAAATRRLLDAVVSVPADDATLAAATAATDDVADRLLAADPRPAGESRARRGRSQGDYLPFSPFLGPAHPAAAPFAWEFVDGRFVARGVLGAAFEGPPGYVHGGWVALMFDEALGVANASAGHPGMTARLTVRYRRPTPLDTELRLEAWTTARQDRRIRAAATLHAGTQLCAEADGLFVDPSAERALEYFGERPAVADPVDPLP
jgi:acyl-coenzyme A thioesterase PaaI-like protein